MALRVSHSAKDMYTSCSYRYKLEYKEKLKPKLISSPLFYGNALDEAFSFLLLSRKRNLEEFELDLMLNETAYTIFEKKMRTLDYYGEQISAPTSDKIKYHKSDVDVSLLTDWDIRDIKRINSELLDVKKFVAYMHDNKGSWEEDEIITYNYIAWLCLYNKGKMLIAEYEKIVLPEIEEVLSIQKNIDIRNEDGDTISGKIDFIAKFKGDPNIYIVDNKTASKAYAKDSVRESPQLATYCAAEGYEHAAYIVVEKNLRKNHPKIRINIIKDTISEEFMLKTLANFKDMLYNVSNEVYEKNYEKNDGSACFFYGAKCPHYDYCRTGNMLYTIDLKEKK